jgi:uncharacterized protein
MNRPHAQSSFILGIFLGLALCLASLPVWGKKPPADCSLAVVSRQLNSNSPVCDTKVVEQMAKTGHAFEQNQMGLASMLVVGPDYSDKEALAWFQRAAERGYAPAQVNLAVMYTNGWGTPVNFGAAQHWLREAANQHFARAYFNLGIFYLEGKGVRKDNNEAFRWFQKGAEAGDSGAQTNLGYMYDLGLGCSRNIATAAELYRKAAIAGNPLGENNLADLYLRGEGVPRDYAAAFQWFQKAAAQGHTGAQIKLGYMYANGQGTEKNPQIAYAWIKAAQIAGDNRGAEMLRFLENVLGEKGLVESQEQVNKLHLATASMLSGLSQ